MLVKRFLSHLGFSLYQVLVLGSVMAAGALIATKLLSDQKLTQKSAQTRGRVEMLHDLVYSVLQHRLNCTETLLQLGTPPEQGNMAHIKSSHSSNLFSIFEAGGHVYMNQQVAIKSISYNPPHLDITYERLDDSEKTRTKNGYGAKEIRKSISLVIQKNPQDGSFLSCYAVKEGPDGNSKLTQTFCESLPGLFQWDSSNNVCRLLDHTCPDGKIFIGINGSDGTAQCNLIGEQMDLSEIISPPDECNPDYANNVRFVLEGNKVGVKCCDVQTSCEIIRASVCNDQPAGKDSCGHDCGVGEKACACTPTTPCSSLVTQSCPNVDVVDSCGNSCGPGTKVSGCESCKPINGGYSDWSDYSACDSKNMKTRTRTCTNPTPNECGASCTELGPSSETISCGEKKIKCQAQWCHLSVTRKAVCYVDGTYDTLPLGGTCTGEDSGRVPCDNPTLCGSCSPVKSCSELVNDYCSYADVTDSCGNSCGKGKRDCSKKVIGTNLIGKCDPSLRYWTEDIVPSGVTYYSGARTCFISQGQIYEKPSRPQSWGSIMDCGCGN